MPYELFLALRYLRMRRGRRVARWTALAAVAGMAFGVAAMITALALANGFREELRDKILRGTAHITLAGADAVSIDELHRAAERLRGVEGVVEAAPTTYEGALLSGPGGAAYTVMRGLDANAARTRAETGRTLTAGALDSLFVAESAGAAHTQSETGRTKAADENSTEGGVDESSVDDEESPAAIIVGEELAERTGLASVGAEGWILSGETTDGGAGFEPRARRVRVAGLFRSGLHDYDASWTYLSIEEATRAAGGRLKSSVVSIETEDIYAAGDVARRVRAAMGEGWTTVDWREANRPLFAALELERRIVTLIILLVTVVAALNITTTLALVVTERRADIAVLSALGARPRSITTVFIIEGALIGAAGALAGVALGLAACYLGEHFELVRLPPDVYSLSAVPLRPHLSDVLLPALAAFAVGLLATIYPSRQAARVRPAEVLRYE